MHVTALVCIVEIPKGSHSKYEFDPELGGIKLAALKAIDKASEQFFIGAVRGGTLH
jgi:hypothetical protein